ncbi:MAG: class I SAM-dependent methyltransferase [Propionibacteriaceae bacterium]|jgi:ubiquinone/menaquinone biosynthesis C-methylase UbiE|nr:class I SAM-dependent methyltransferase [Propionibacteriaceae bacterium]
MRSVHTAILEAILGYRPAPKSLLDIGCGDGVFTRTIAATLPQTAITAVDVKQSKRFVGAKNITFKTGSAEALPVDSDAYDLVTASLTLHHWTNQPQAITEVFRVLKPGGLFIIGDPLLENWLINRFWGWLVQTLDGGRFASAQTLQTWAQDAGLDQVEINLIPRTMKSLYLVTARKPA